VSAQDRKDSRQDAKGAKKTKSIVSAGALRAQPYKQEKGYLGALGVLAAISLTTH